MKQVHCSPKSDILTRMIGNFDNFLPIGSSDWHHYFTEWYGGCSLVFLEGCGASTLAQAHSTSSYLELEMNFFRTVPYSIQHKSKLGLNENCFLLYAKSLTK